ncbi:MAG: Uncharacterized protein G01um101416_591 [Microgenomates group bacterium Gr01-1014_16]|nr:MAG: Uncharacterized protein G01um101416_591 [Microgenomates group bacterium Gr01-1014_16]
MKILEIYAKYKIPPQLQTHQLRVAAVSKLICNNLKNFSETEIVVKNSLNNNLPLKICACCDFRVTPHAVTSLRERLDEARARCNNNLKMIQSDPEKFEAARAALINIEKEIFSSSSIKPEDINDESARDVIEDLKSMDI